MARKNFTELTQEEQLFQVPCDDDLIANYVNKKAELEQLDKIVKKLGDEVKRVMKERDLKVTECNGYKVNRIESQRVTWNEDALLEKVKTFNRPELICTIEKVDVPNLENAIINEEIDINEIKDCQKVTNIVSLRMDKIKEVKE